ncbi:MAG: hypothetical protein ACPHGY_09580 [Rhodospirillaceae bacterium]
MRYDNLILAVLAVVIGTVVGWAVAGFRTLIDLIQSVGFGSAAAVVLATDTVETAVRAILAAGRNYLPVVRSSEDQFLVGSVSAGELLRAVNMALISADAEAKIR